MRPLVLAAPSLPVRRVLGITGADARLPMAPTFVDGLTELASGTTNRPMSALER
jgi:hypothetical protein